MKAKMGRAKEASSNMNVALELKILFVSVFPFQTLYDLPEVEIV